MASTNDAKNEEIPITKISHSTHILVKQFVYEWKIKNFEYCHLSDGDYLESLKFVTVDQDDSFEWALEVYPHGYTKDIRDQVSVRLYLYEYDSAENAFKQVDIQLSLVNGTGDEVNVEKKLISKTDWFNDEAVFRNFISRKQLLDEANDLLPNNELTILCKFFFNKGQRHQSTLAVDGKPIVDQVPIERRLLEFDDFEKLLDNPVFSDVEIVVGDKKFPAHKNILSSRSRYFENIFQTAGSCHDRLEIDGVEVQVMREVLRFVYTGKIEQLPKLSRDLLVYAEKYEMEGLREICERALIDHLALDLDNVGDMLALVDKCRKAENLKKVVIDFVTKHSKDLMDRKDFKAIFAVLTPTFLAEVIAALISKM
ncbi:hypothetical protein TSAR_014930 [Trichomalopsis sarcophagae]|uniref:BTB domain-containing protein n=1 Tax=Trichomalopsis sarcophagae TaxID=543379 RepID=A0A232FLX9_9HYME|nr:hypothetical protein TSAR_014930 [Trichomalopsis sarcophagae]